MLNDLSTRAKFGLTAIAVALIGILVVLFLPMSVTETMYYSRENIILLTPETNLKHFGIAIIVIVFVFVLLAFKRNIFMYSLSTLIILSCIVISFLTLTNYIAIQNEQIIIKDYDGESIYPWTEIDEIVYEYVFEENGKYIFRTKNNEQFIIYETAKFGNMEKSKIYMTARNLNIKFIERAAEGS